MFLGTILRFGSVFSVANDRWHTAFPFLTVVVIVMASCFFLCVQLVRTRMVTASVGPIEGSVKVGMNSTWKLTARRAVNTVEVAAAAAAAAAEVVVEVVEAVVDQKNVVTNQVQGLLVAPRPPKAPGLGKHKFELLEVLRSAGGLWFILNGLSPQLTASLENLLHRYVYGELRNLKFLYLICKAKLAKCRTH